MNGAACLGEPSELTGVNRCECDPSGTGSIDREAFVQGMWRIDEELSRKAIARRTRVAPVPPRKPHVPYAVRR